MPSQYKTVAGVRYERDLLEFADCCLKARGSIDYSDAVKLWDQAKDGGRITETEKRTLVYIVQKYNIDAQGKQFLLSSLESLKGQLQSSQQAQSSSKSYYVCIDGIKYDRNLIEQAKAYSASGPITTRAAAQIWANAHDGSGVTNTELRTLRYILDNFPFCTDSSRFLRNVLGGPALLDEPEPETGKVIITEQASNTGLELDVYTEDKATQSSWLSPIQKLRQWVFSKRTSDSALPPCERRPAKKQCTKDTRAGPEIEVPGEFFGMHSTQDAPPTSSSRKTETGEPSVNGGCAATANNLMGGLSAELRGLLEEHRPGISLEDTESGHTVGDDQAKAEMAKAASNEVDRILTSRTRDELLGGGSSEEQQQKFRRIVRLLHPDKGHVKKDDERAAIALRLVLAAIQRARIQRRT